MNPKGFSEPDVVRCACAPQRDDEIACLQIAAAFGMASCRTLPLEASVEWA